MRRLPCICRFAVPLLLLPSPLPARTWLVPSEAPTIQAGMEGAPDPGTYRVQWNGRDARGRAVAGGVYFYRFNCGDFTEARRMVLLRT